MLTQVLIRDQTIIAQRNNIGQDVMEMFKTSGEELVTLSATVLILALVCRY